MATHSSFLAWEIPWTENLEGSRPWDHKESDMTEHTHTHIHTHTDTHTTWKYEGIDVHEGILASGRQEPLGNTTSFDLLCG